MLRPCDLKHCTWLRPISFQSDRSETGPLRIVSADPDLSSRHVDAQRIALACAFKLGYLILPVNNFERDADPTVDVFAGTWAHTS
jgi:hypothetical protein